MKKIFVLLVLIIASTPVFAAEWLQYSNKGWLDLSSKKIIGDTVTVWFKDLNPGDWEKQDNKKVWYIINQYRANCNKRTLTQLAAVSYDLKGNVIYTHFNKQYEQLEEPVIPETTGEWKYYFMCGKP